MKIIIIGVALLAAAMGFSQNNESEASIPKANRHSVGVRQTVLSNARLFPGESLDGYYAKHKITDLHVQYVYRLKKRWGVGLEYTYREESSKFYEPAASNASKYDLTTEEVIYSNLFRVLGSYDIIQKKRFVLRANAYLPFYGLTKVLAPVDSRRYTYNKVYAGQTYRGFRGGENPTGDMTAPWFSPELVIDALFLPNPNLEVGLSIYANFRSGYPIAGLYATMNYKF